MRTIDVVILVAPKDTEKAQSCLAGILQNSLNPIRKIHIVAPVQFALEGPLDVPVSWALDAEFPFSAGDIREVLRRKGSQHENASWYYQQLLKLYAFRAIDGLAEDFLILDSDFIITKRVRFLTDEGKGVLAFGYPFKWLLGTSEYPESVEHVHAEFAANLVPGWRPQHPFSGMQHHMLFQRAILEDLFDVVERTWEQEFWQAFIDHVHVDKWNAASEYVIYHHFALSRHPDKVVTHHMNTRDLIFDSDEREAPWRLLDEAGGQGQFSAIGFHGFLKLRERLATMDYIPDALRREMLTAKRPVFKLTLQDGSLAIEGA